MSDRKNNLYTRGYFVKRLRESGVPCEHLVDHYDASDERKWTVLAWPTSHRALITCHRPSSDNFWFKADFSKTSVNIKTLSMDVVCDNLKLMVCEAIHANERHDN